MSNEDHFRLIKQALETGSMDMIRRAVDMGASLLEFEKTGPSVIIEMVRSCCEKQNDTPSISELLRLGADPNKVGPQGLSPLCFVMMRLAGDRSSMAESVISLLCAGASVDSVLDNEICDMTWRPRHREVKSYPLALAIQIGSLQSAEALLLAGASPNGLDDPNSLNPLSMAAKWREDGFAQLLLMKGADPNLRNGDGTVAMHHCWEHKTAKILLDAGANLDVEDHHRRRPLHDWVSQIDDPSSLCWLADKSPLDRFREDNEGLTPLDILRDRYKTDLGAAGWAGEIIASWEADLLAEKMDISTDEGQSDSSSRRL